VTCRTRCCHYCGQTLPTLRLNRRLTELKARIFDLIQRGGEDGILARDLRDILDMSANTLKAHVQQINTTVLGSGYRIYGRGGIYRLRRARSAPPTSRLVAE
jgi:hypothetical protein